MPGIRSFAYADDLALFSDSVKTISPALLLISEFSLVSGLGVNKDKSAAITPLDGQPSVPISLSAVG